MENKKIIVGLLVLLVALTVLVIVPKKNTDRDPNTNEIVVNDVTDDHHQEDNDKTKDFEIYPGDVVKKIEGGENIILLDVRQPDEYEEIHLQDALLLPVEELSTQTLEAIGLGDDKKDKEIILYCRSGARSQVAYNIMSSLGYTNIKSTTGGMVHWQEDNYPYTETGAYMGPSWNSDSIQAKQTISSDAPDITINEPFYDFGIIPKSGGTVTRDFIVSNRGKQNLEIGNLTTSCSCTSATISENSIKPGKSATLTVVFDPDFHEEPLDVFKRTVFIPTNDPDTLEAEVVIQVDIDETN